MIFQPRYLSVFSLCVLYWSLIWRKVLVTGNLVGICRKQILLKLIQRWKGRVTVIVQLNVSPKGTDIYIRLTISNTIEELSNGALNSQQQTHVDLTT